MVSKIMINLSDDVNSCKRSHNIREIENFHSVKNLIFHHGRIIVPMAFKELLQRQPNKEAILILHYRQFR